MPSPDDGGELFSRAYLRPIQPLSYSDRMRVRLYRMFDAVNLLNGDRVPMLEAQNGVGPKAGYGGYLWRQ